MNAVPISSAEAQPSGHVLADSGVQQHGCRENQTDLTTQVKGQSRRHDLSMKEQPAFLLTDQKGEGKQEGALARPVRTDHGHSLVRVDGELLDPQYLTPSPDHTEVPDLQYGRRGPSIRVDGPLGRRQWLIEPHVSLAVRFAGPRSRRRSR